MHLEDLAAALAEHAGATPFFDDLRRFHQRSTIDLIAPFLT
jgi:hypothetical protein